MHESGLKASPFLSSHYVAKTAVSKQTTLGLLRAGAGFVPGGGCVCLHVTFSQSREEEEEETEWQEELKDFHEGQPAIRFGSEI